MTLVAPSGRRLVLGFRKHKALGLSRLKFDQHLLSMTVDAGAELVEEKVIGLERKYGWWKVRTNKKSYVAETVVGADGVNSMVRRTIIGSLSRRDKGVCFGYFVKGLENGEITLKLLPDKKGYFWIIPRGEDTSIGIGSSEMRYSFELKNELDAFLHGFYPRAEKISAWTALIPNVKNTITLPHSHCRLKLGVNR